MKDIFTYLALGDSYTIGEGIPLQKSFPYQLIQLLRKKGIPISAPEIIAKTGWTTGELLLALESYNLLENYKLVTILIGVNNQYRGLSIDEYQQELEKLVSIATVLTQNDPDSVYILSIPDYSLTPFSENRDRELISWEIELFNNINRRLSEKYQVNYIDITSNSKDAEKVGALVAADGLHPSEKEYKRWSQLLGDQICKKFEVK